MKKVLILAVLLFGQISCRDTKCGGEPEYPYYDLRNITLQTYRLTTNPGDTSPGMEPLLSGDTVVFHKLYIRLTGEANYHAQLTRKGSFSFMSSAMACSPARISGYKGTRERIEAITITSNADFDAAHPAGTTLNDLFMVNYIELQNYQPGPDTDLNTFLAKPDNQPPMQLNFLLKQAPATGLKQKFTIVYRFANGEMYTLQTADLLIK